MDRKGVLAIISVAFAVASPVISVGAHQVWWAVESGDWEVPWNWEGGLPWAGAEVYVENGGSVRIYDFGSSPAECWGLYVGSEVGSGYVDHTIGYNQVNYELVVSRGTYHLAEPSSRLHAWREVIASENGFLHDGGTNWAKEIIISDSSTSTRGEYVMSSGVLITDVLSVQRNGAFCMVGSNAGIAIHGEFGLEEGSAFLAMPGTEIEMRGAVFANISTDPVALSGLANASFSFGWAPNPCPFEVAGVDIGPVMEGWTDNFAVGGLVLGRLGAGRIQLVDDCDNQLNGPRNEALYVHDLAFNSGGSIDLNGRNLYYLNGGDPRQFFFGDANLDGGVDGADYTLWADHYKMADMAWGDGDFNGDTVVDGADYTTWADNFLAGGARPAPEPATLSLLALGGLALIRRRR